MSSIENSEKKKYSRQRILVEGTLEHKIIFAASQLDIGGHPDGGYSCNISGEFYKVEISDEGKETEKAFEPPLSYVMYGVRVNISDVKYILREIYHYLQEEDNSGNNPPVRKIGFI